MEVAALAASGVCLLGAAIDLRTRKVPNWLTLPAMAAFASAGTAARAGGAVPAAVLAAAGVLGLLLLARGAAGRLPLPGWLLASWAVLAAIASAAGGEPRRAVVEAGLVCALWAALYGLWRVGVYGGGDARLLMALFALYPDADFAATLALGTLALVTPQLAWRYRHALVLQPGLAASVLLAAAGSPAAALSLAARLPRPGQAALRLRGKRHTWAIAVPTLAYLWLPPR